MIGTKNNGAGYGLTELSITFNQNATTDVVRQLLRSIKFKTVGSPNTDTRLVSFALTDGFGGVSEAQVKQITIA
jgi:hypothetical protein